MKNKTFNPKHFGEWPVIVEGKTIIRPPQITDEEKDFHCIRATRERLVWAHRNKLKPCSDCVGTDIDNLDAFNKLVKDINNGVKREECKSCWTHEANGYKSYREHGNDLWKTIGVGNSHSEVIYNRNCDAACLYCNKSFSTAWEEELANTKHQIPDFLKDSTDYNAVDLSKGKKTALKIIKEVAEDYRKYACIGVYGGEPTITLLETNYMEELIETFYKHNKMWHRRLRYDINSNFNFSEEKCYKLIEKLNNTARQYTFVDFVLQPSFESIGKNFEFIRSGCKWENLNRNLDTFLKETDYEIEIKSAINNVSLENLPQFLKFMNEKCKTIRPFGIRIDCVRTPKMFSIEILESNFGKYFEEAWHFFKNNETYFLNTDSIVLQLKNVETLINHCHDNEKLPEIINAIEFYDYIEKERNVRLLDANPELYYYFQMLRMSAN